MYGLPKTDHNRLPMMTIDYAHLVMQPIWNVQYGSVH